MKWMRFKHGAREGFGVLQGLTVQVHEGSLFDHPIATSEQIATSDIEWLIPCQPTKMIGL